jgi:dienelactone hydrolase
MDVCKFPGQRLMPPEALKWLAVQPDVDVQRLRGDGFSLGGMMPVLMSSGLIQERRLGKDVPAPVAFASFYPTCSNLHRSFSPAATRMSAKPMLIYVGTRDDYEEGERSCDSLIATWLAAARKQVIVRYVEGATHGFDSQTPKQRRHLWGSGQR